MTHSSDTHSDNCTGFLVSLDMWLEGELDNTASLAMQAHHNECPQCQQETLLAREVSSITHTLPMPVCPELTLPDRGKPSADVSAWSGLHLVSQLLNIWRQPLVYVPAFALVLAVVVGIQTFGTQKTDVSDIVIINGQEYTREEVIQAAEELELALQYLDKYGSYPARVVHTELRESHLPLPPPREDTPAPAI